MCQHFPVLNDRKAVLTKLLAKRKGWECWAATSRANVWSFPWLRCQGCCLFLGGLGPLLKWQRALCIVALEVTVSPWARQLSLCFVCRGGSCQLEAPGACLAGYFPGWKGSPLPLGEGLEGRVSIEKTPPLPTTSLFRPKTQESPLDTCFRETRPSWNWAGGQSSWSKEAPMGPAPEKHWHLNFLPGFEASVNFLPFLFGTEFHVSARCTQHL